MFSDKLRRMYACTRSRMAVRLASINEQTNGESYLLILLRQIDVLFHVGLHAAEEVRVDGLAQHSGALVSCGHLRRELISSKNSRPKIPNKYKTFFFGLKN